MIVTKRRYLCAVASGAAKPGTDVRVCIKSRILTSAVSAVRWIVVHAVNSQSALKITITLGSGRRRYWRTRVSIRRREIDVSKRHAARRLLCRSRGCFFAVILFMILTFARGSQNRFGRKVPILVLLLLILFSPVLSAAADDTSYFSCANYLELRAPDISTLSRNAVVVSALKDRRSWFQNPDWSGNSPIPTPIDGSMMVSDDNHPTPTKIFFSVSLLQTLPADLRILGNNLKLSAKPMTEDEAEMGAIVARYESGSSKGIRYTSKTIDFILGPDLDKAINRSNVFPNRENELIKKVYHLHTHPDLRNPVFGGRRSLIVPSVYDYNLWADLRSQLRKYHPGVAFEGIVAPAGAEVNDIVFVVTDQHLDAYEREKATAADKK